MKFLTGTSDQPEKFTETQHTQNENSWHLILKWMQQCTSTHDTCQPRSVSTRKNKLPARLIAVGNITSPIVRVIETSDFGDSVPVYMTLSHCWGNHVPVRLLAETHSGSREWDVKDLPKTFADAVTVTRKLGVHYLWIDSLCIIQDSHLDWATESSQMHNVYRNSYLNIAAAASDDSTGGLWYPRSPLEFAPCCVKIGQGANAKYVVSEYVSEEASEEELVLFTRGWVFQEWLLAPRTVVFGKRDIYWECSNVLASEIRPEGLRSSDNIYNKKLLTLRNQWRNIQKQSITSRLGMWNTVIEEYSQQRVTKFSDKLVAIAGLAADMGEPLYEMKYLAGLWSYKLRQSLLWQFYYTHEFVQRPRSCIPSWSWASVKGRVSMEKARVGISDNLVEIVEATVQLSAPSNIYGSVTGGSIRITGPILRAIIDIRSLSQRYIRIGEIDDQAQAHNPGDGDPSFHSQIGAWISLDDSTLDKVQDPDVYLAPFEVFFTEWKVGREMRLVGLVLLPTYCIPGQFRRVGYFSITEYWGENEHPQNFERIKNIASQMVETFPAEESLQTGDEGTREDVEEKIHELLENDPYGNGVVNTTLVDRYGEENRDIYLQINSLLSAAFLQFKKAEADGTLRDDIYGQSHGDGHFAYEIV